MSDTDASAPATPTGPRLDLLNDLGFGELQHDSHVPFLSHLLGTRRLLVAWGASPALCDAGLFHSVYGTEYFVPDRQPERQDVIDVIGADAERIAWLWCAGERATLDPHANTIRLRETHDSEPLTPQELSDVATLWAADTVEQLHRMVGDEQAFSNGILHVIEWASAPAQAAVRELPLTED